MAFFGGLGIGLSLMFVFLILALVVQLSYLLCWKKRVQNCESQEKIKEKNQENQDLELGPKKDLVIKAFTTDQENVEAEVMRFHNLRFLFTIKEETKEDLESEDAKSRKGSRTRSLSDIILAIDNPKSLESYNHHGFNPLFEAEIHKLRSSPPPKFKFLRDAEEKLFRKLIQGAENRVQDSAAVEGSFLGVIKKENGNIFDQLQEYTSSSSQVLPLSSAPTTLTQLDKNLNNVQ